MMVIPPCDTANMTTQLRLLAGGEPPNSPSRPRARRSNLAARPTAPASVYLDARTRQIGQSGVSEARRRLAEIRATTERVNQLVQAS